MSAGPVSAEEFNLAGERTHSDPSALRQEVTRIFAAFREQIYRQCLRIVARPADAEDLTQEAFLRLYTEMRQKRAIDNPRAWLFRTAYNLAIDRYRANRNLCSLGAGDVLAEAEVADDPSQRLEQTLLSREKKEQIGKLLAGLSPQERRCMELRTEGLRYREIAEVLKVRITTVETNLSRAVKKLMEKLDV